MSRQTEKQRHEEALSIVEQIVGSAKKVTPIYSANDPWIRVHSGGQFHLLKPRPHEFNIKDIAWSLSGQNRFYNHTRKPYSTAEHAVRASLLVAKPFRLVTLCHDNAEFALGDVSSRLKVLLPDYKRIEHIVEKAMAKHFKLPFPFPPEVKQADLVMLATEMRDLLPGADWSHLPYRPLREKIVPWSQQKAYREFLKAFRRYSR